MDPSDTRLTSRYIQFSEFWKSLDNVSVMTCSMQAIHDMCERGNNVVVQFFYSRTSPELFPFPNAYSCEKYEAMWKNRYDDGCVFVNVMNDTENDTSENHIYTNDGSNPAENPCYQYNEALSCILMSYAIDKCGMVVIYDGPSTLGLPYKRCATLVRKEMISEMWFAFGNNNYDPEYDQWSGSSHAKRKPYIGSVILMPRESSYWKSLRSKNELSEPKIPFYCESKADFYDSAEKLIISRIAKYDKSVADSVLMSLKLF
jgi:hypothetical protein